MKIVAYNKDTLQKANNTMSFGMKKKKQKKKNIVSSKLEREPGKKKEREKKRQTNPKLKMLHGICRMSRAFDRDMSGCE